MPKQINVALIGNPNTGKTSVFNALTGLNQKVGNYPGITVEKKEGVCKLPKGLKAHIIDLPGTYSLNASSLDENVVIELLLNKKDKDFPDVAVRDFEIILSNDIVYLYLLYSTYFKTVIITDPYHPQQIVSFTVSSETIIDWAFTEDNLCIIHGSWIKIINIVDPINPEIVGEFNGTLNAQWAEAEYILAYNNFIYTTFQCTISGPGGSYWWEQMNTLDISNSSQPTLVNTSLSLLWNRGIFSNNKVYITDGNLHIYDLSDPVYPQLYYTYYSDGNLSDLTIQGNSAYAADGNNGVLKLDITSNPVLIGHYFSEPIQPYITDVKKIGNYAYLIDRYHNLEWGENKFRVIDVSDPFNPFQTYEMDLISASFEVTTGYAYFVTGENNNILKLHIIDVNDPYNPQEIGSVDLEGNYIYDVNLSGNYLYLCIRTGLYILDISNPENPIVFGPHSLSHGAIKSYSFQNFLYVASAGYIDYQDICVYDITDRTSPVLLGSLVLNGRVATDIAAKENYLFVSTWNSQDRLMVIDVSNPNNPQEIIEIYPAGSNSVPWDLSIQNNYLYLSETVYGVRIFNVVDPPNIEEVALYNSDTFRSDASSNLIYAAQGILGLGIVKNDLITNFATEDRLPTSFMLSQNYPNPFNPTTIIKYQVPKISYVSIKVYDVLGNEIAALLNEEKPAGSYEIEFIGNGLTSGIYFYQLRAGNFVETKKMVLLR